MAPPHLSSSHKHTTSTAHPAVRTHKSATKHGKTHKPAQQATRLNKAPLSGNRILKSRALSLQASDARVDKKRSRPRASKNNEGKLAGLGSLGDALPNEGITAIPMGDKKMRRIVQPDSLKSRPGAMKRRAKLERSERERFGLNLAVLASGSPAEDKPQNQTATAPRTDDEKQATSTKWEALRRHIATSLENS